jgi:hypothetical protein
LARAIDRLGRSTLRESPKAGEAERNDESFALPMSCGQRRLRDSRAGAALLLN